MLIKKCSILFSHKARAATIEYGLIALLISIAANSMLQLSGTNLVATVTAVATNL
jgi:Flp pilus assembly pilin Flp